MKGILNSQAIVVIIIHEPSVSERYYYREERVDRFLWKKTIYPEGIYESKWDGEEFICKVDAFNQTELSSKYFLNVSKEVVVKYKCRIHLVDRDYIDIFFDTLQQANNFADNAIGKDNAIRY